jgi:hypothetical protein
MRRTEWKSSLKTLLFLNSNMHKKKESSIDNMLDLGNKKGNSRKELIKISKIAKFGYEML